MFHVKQKGVENMEKVIDVSKWQGVIDWAKVKRAGYNKVIIRAGYGQTVDERFITNITGALKNNMEVGCYWFLYARDITEGLLNAKKFLETVENYSRGIILGLWLDVEGDSDAYATKRGITLTKTTRTNIVKETLEELKKRHNFVGLYANKDYLNNKLYDMSEYPLWYARYSNTLDRACYMWQYSSKGNVDGIKGNVDMSNLYDEFLVSSTRKKLRVSTLGSNLNARAGAGMNYKIVGKFKNKTVLELVKDCGKWVEVVGEDINGKAITGFVSKTYVKEI